MLRRNIRGGVLGVSLLALAAPVFAQGGRAEINGTIFDQNKAILPGATVTATNEATGGERTAVSVCSGGPFEGAAAPTYPFTANDPRNCYAVPTQTGSRPKGARLLESEILHVGTHYVGSQTLFFYAGIRGVLQVQDPDISQSGPFARLSLSYFLISPEEVQPRRSLSTGWVETERFGDRRLVYTEAVHSPFSDFSVFEQYPLVDGSEYAFQLEVDTFVDPFVWYAALWWNNRWNVLGDLTPHSPVLPYALQYMLAYTEVGIHPSVAPMTNYGSELRIVGVGWQPWDLGVWTAWTDIPPYCLDWLVYFGHWRVRYCP